MIDKITCIDNKIHQLKQKKERVQTQQALFLMKEAQKILKEEFSPMATLNIIKDSWATASKTQKTEWTTRATSFPTSSPRARKKTETHNSAPEQSGKAETPHHVHP